MSELEQHHTQAASLESQEPWERDILNRLAFATLNEQRRTRRWGIFFKILIFIYLFALLFLFNPNWEHWHFNADEPLTDSQHTALIEIDGLISPDTEASADNVISGLRAAFKDDDTAGIILRINSPGGSPVQSSYINDEIKRLREKYKDKNIPLYAVITDICASGGYYIAVAADKIYANSASMVGSIGVLMNGFGFVEALDKLGIERRLLTAGEHKGFLDPFSPMAAEDAEHIKTLLENVHQQFIQAVEAGRGERLNAEQKAQLFSGLIWTGEQAVELGLVDALGSSSYVAREIFKAEKIKDFTRRPTYLDRFAERLGATLATTLTQHLERTMLQ